MKEVVLDAAAERVAGAGAAPEGAGAHGSSVLARVCAAVSCLLILAPALGGLLYVLRFGVDVPFWDEWQGIPVLQQVAHGKLGWSDLFQLHNEHRLLFPRLVMLAVNRLTAFDVRAQMIVGWGFLVAAGAVLFAAHRRIGRTTLTRSLLEFVPVAWLLFTLRQSQNYLWGWQLQITLCLLALVVAFSLLVRPTTLRVAAAAGAAIVASYSFANGVLVFPIGALALLSCAGERRRFAWLGGWLAVGAATTALFLWGWAKPAHHPSEATILSHPWEGVRYLLASQGSPFTWRVDHSLWLGAAVLLLLVVSAWMSRRRPIPLGVLLGLFSVGSGMVLAVGRLGFGVEQALSSRYVTFTLLSTVGAYECFREVWQERLAARILGIAVAAGMIAAVPAGTRWGLREAEVVRSGRLTMAAILPSYAALSDDALRLLFEPSYVREKAAFLERKRLSVFRSAPGRLEGAVPFAIQKIEHRPAEGGLESLEVSGWAVDPRARTRAAAILVRVDGAPYEVAFAGLATGDVAGALNEPGYDQAGFELKLPGVRLAPGVHVVDLRVVTPSGDYWEIPGAASFSTR